MTLDKAARDETKTVLRLFREFVQENATQWKLGASHHHPIWALVAETLGDENDRATTPEEWRAYVHVSAASNR